MDDVSSQTSPVARVHRLPSLVQQAASCRRRRQGGQKESPEPAGKRCIMLATRWHGVKSSDTNPRPAVIIPAGVQPQLPRPPFRLFYVRGLAAERGLDRPRCAGHALAVSAAQSAHTKFAWRKSAVKSGHSRLRCWKGRIRYRSIHLIQVCGPLLSPSSPPCFQP